MVVVVRIIVRAEVGTITRAPITILERETHEIRVGYIKYRDEETNLMNMQSVRCIDLKTINTTSDFHTTANSLIVVWLCK